MPVLKALDRLTRGPHGEGFVQLLRHEAPSWLVHLPWTITPEELAALDQRWAGTSVDQMIRTIVHALETLTREIMLVLVLEDLHWADSATIAFLPLLARRPERARLLVIATYRPAEAIVQGGMLETARLDWKLHRRCEDVALELWEIEDVHAYMGLRFGVEPEPSLVSLLHRHTDGNPLFVTAVVDYLDARDWLRVSEGGVELGIQAERADAELPTSLRELVELQLALLGPSEIALLEAASVAGVEFDAQEAAAATEVDVQSADTIFERLAREHCFLRMIGEQAWPDGSVAGRYAFTHAVHQETLYRRVAAARRRAFHQRIGERLERGYAGRTDDIAVELALHFERSRDAARAVDYLECAAAHASRRHAPRECSAYLERALAALLARLEDDARLRREKQLRMALMAAQVPLKGWPSDEVVSTLGRVLELAEDGEDPRERLRLAYALCVSLLARGDAEALDAALAQLRTTAALVDTEAARLTAEFVPAFTAVWRGDYSAAAGMGAYADLDPILFAPLIYGSSPVATGPAVDAWRLWLCGHPDRALATAHRALEIARMLDPINLGMGLFFAARVHLWRGELEHVAALAEESRRLSDEHGLGFWGIAMDGVAGWAIALSGTPERGAAALTESLARFAATGARVFVPSLYAGLAETALSAGRREEGLNAVERGLRLSEEGLDRMLLAELWRLKGELLALDGGDPESDACLQRALSVSRAQGARALELRAAMSLFRRLQASGRDAEARALLTEIVESFAEGHATGDVRDAHALLTSR